MKSRRVVVIFCLSFSESFLLIDFFYFEIFPFFPMNFPFQE